MSALLSLFALVALLAGLILAIAAALYRTAELRALPWYKQFYPRWRVGTYYAAPGHLLASISASLLALGAIMLVITMLSK